MIVEGHHFIKYAMRALFSMANCIAKVKKVKVKVVPDSLRPHGLSMEFSR